MVEKEAKPPVDLDQLGRLLERCMLRDQVRLTKRLQRLRRRRQQREIERLQRQIQSSMALRARREAGAPAVSYPAELPIAACKDEIIRTIAQNQVVVIAGETGSGKTTQLPKMCLEVGRGRAARIAVTQPRRVAALSLSRRLAEELGVRWGREVGCKVRFTDQTAPQTYVKMLTDGMLLAEIQGDADLLEYDTIIIDEAHERSLNIDFLLGYLRLLYRRRPELKIIITSATIDTEAFSEAFGGAPIIEVSGRVYPVEVRHWPLEELLGAGEDYTYIEGAVQAVEQLLEETQSGDVLVFMPGERDIRETRDLLEGRRLRGVEILPLFSRLTAAEQQRVFSPQGRRRVVVATNVAETSLTIPNIRYVVDTGLARVSRYNARNQIQRLPIEPVSQSSAAQRQGRCGRVQNGVCVRLYSEEDFLARPEFTQPEIQRANLAEVILRMLATRLGQPETFPFIDPPRLQAIKGGYQLLEELGALDSQRRLTRLGKDLARLPIAPTVGRMVLEAKRQKALTEVLVIAAGISIQDPRERPLEQQEAADGMHRQFIDRRSDFLTLYNIWNAYHERLEELKTQNQMRKFCRSHFLSYVRMREWRDIHTQLRRSLAELEGFAPQEQPAEYEAVHRSVTSGLLSNVAAKNEHNLYRAARGGEVMLFPGSGLFQRKDTDKAPGWIVAAEMVETSRLFARTAAQVEAGWLLELAKHLCRFSYKDPYWDEKAGRVLVRETVRLYGLELVQRPVPYNRVDAQKATEIFVREALVGDQIRSPHPFLEHNRRLCAKIEAWQTRVRSRQGVDVDQARYDFYAQRLGEVSSVHELNRLVRQKRSAEPRFLFMEEKDLLGVSAAEFDQGAFPEALEVDGTALPLDYAFRPGQEEDGLTVKVPYKLVHAIQPEVLEWLVPGLLEEKIVHLLRSLPKAVRKQFVPVPATAQRLAARLKPTDTSFLASLEACIRQELGIVVHRSDWQAEDLPEHLRMRVEVSGENGQVVAADRDLGALAQRLERRDQEVGLDAWQRAAAKWEKDGVKAWDFGDLPERIEVAAVSGVPVWGYPGIEPSTEGVCLKLFNRRERAAAATQEGLVRLLELSLKAEMAFLKRDLKELGEYKHFYHGLCSAGQLQQDALVHLRRHLFARQALYPLNAERFAADQARAKKELRGLSTRLIDQLVPILQLYRDIRLCPHPYQGLDEDLARLLPADFLLQTPFGLLSSLCRYLKAVLVRAERARSNPSKDAQKAAQIKVYDQALQRLRAGAEAADQQQGIEEFRWAVEELRVSIFAQELGTAFPVSPKRLEKMLAALEKR